MPQKVKNKWNYKKMFFLVLATSWVTGLAFFILNNFYIMNGEFGGQKHSWQYPILKIHGGSSFFIMVVFGYFLSAHVRKNWYSRKSKPILGVALLIMPILSMITAYILYYISSDGARQIVSYIHFFIGFFLPFMLIIHIVQMTRSKTKNSGNFV